jgi:2-phospho-L-lactate/phosphoenolpyruvate guanylyltransferase
MNDDAVLLVPAKRLEAAKTRMATSAQHRAEIAMGLLGHTLTAAARSGAFRACAVVTSDEVLAALAREHGVAVVVESPLGGLNPAIDLARSWAREQHPTTVTCVMVADLGHAEASDVRDLVREHRRQSRPWFVPDAQGVGTTTVLLPAGDRRPTRFGPGSARRHLLAGYASCPLEVPSLRADVDMLDEVPRALRPPSTLRRPIQVG